MTDREREQGATVSGVCAAATTEPLPPAARIHAPTGAGGTHTAAAGDSEVAVREIQLTRGFVALVNDEDYERVAAFEWHALTTGGKVYAARKEGTRRTSRSVLLHRFVLGVEQSVLVDHIDGDGLNCRRLNLRAATSSQNQGNRRRNRNGSSQFKGVGWHAGAKKWRARISRAGVVREIGLFADERDAARAYDAAARVQFGSFAAVNFPENGEAWALRSA